MSSHIRGALDQMPSSTRTGISSHAAIFLSLCLRTFDVRSPVSSTYPEQQVSSQQRLHLWLQTCPIRKVIYSCRKRHRLGRPASELFVEDMHLAADVC